MRPSLLSILAPTSLLPYLHLSRLDKPIGTLLLLFPCYFSLSLSTLPSHLPSPSLLALFALGALSMRGAGCTVNDWWDARFDAQVARTRHRPLASGLLSTSQAAAWLVAQLSVGLAVVLALPLHTLALSFAIVPLTAVYPAMKRVTHWPQAVLGLCFNWGALVGYTAGGGALGWGAGALYGAGVCWTVLYDTVYAHQDAAEDRTLGLRSTALYFGERTAAVLAGVGAVMVAALGAVGWVEGMGGWYYAGVAGVAAHVAWQVGTLDVRDRARCWRLFVSNRWLGWILLAGIVVDRWMAPRDEGKETERAEAVRRGQETGWGNTGYQLLGELWRKQRTPQVNAAPAAVAFTTAE